MRLSQSRSWTAVRTTWWVYLGAATALALLLSALNQTLGGRAEPAEANAAPGSGLFVFGGTTGAAFSSAQSSGGNYLVKWASLEPSSGSYSWTSLDAALGRAQSAGRKLVLRVYNNWSVFGQGTPDWFFNLSGARFYYPADTAQERGYEAPVPWDAVFQQRFGAFVQALGQRYNGHPALEFIQITGIGVYGEVYLGQLKPSDFSATNHLSASKYWIDVWRNAFPDTELALMVNGIGSNIGENAAAHAVSRGYYLQSNSHKNTIATRAIIATHDEDTLIAIEAENGGCRTATVAKGFEAQMVETFSLGYSIDYLMLCYESFTDGATVALLPWVISQLRSSTGGSVATATATTPATATAQATVTAIPTWTSTPLPSSTPLLGVAVTGIDPTRVANCSCFYQVLISGSGFEPGAMLAFSGGSGPAPTASSIIVSSDGQTLTARLTLKVGGPPRNRVWDVNVTNPDSQTGTLAGGLMVTAP